MSKIHIMQLLCPLRHCIVALPYDPEATTEKEAKLTVTLGVAAVADPWCGICGSRDWHFESGATRFDSMEEALPHLMEEERKNQAARRHFANLRRAAKNN